MSQLKFAVVAGPEPVKTCVLSIVSVNVIGVPAALPAVMPTGTMPLTVAPSAGVVKPAISWPATVTLRVAVPVLPTASCTVSCS